MKKLWISIPVAVAAIALSATGWAKSPIVIGAAIAETGPVSSLGTGEVKAINMFVKHTNANGGIDGHPLKVVLLDTASKPQKAVLNVRKLITQYNAVGILCCTTTPETMAILDTVQRDKIPTISLGSASIIVQPAAKRHWMFKTPPMGSTMIDVEVKDMQKLGIKTAGYLGFNTALGQTGLKNFKQAAAQAGIKIIDVEQFAPTDTNVTAQAAKLAEAKPDAILIIGNPPGANVAQKAVQSAGFKGTIYQTYGVTNATYLRLGGASLNGTRISVPPITAFGHLPDSVPSKPVIETFVKNYKAFTGGKMPNNFAGFAHDAINVFSIAAGDVLSSGKAKLADTGAFRAALRNAIESQNNYVGVSGVYHFSQDNHVGVGPDSVLMVTVENGGYQPAK